MNTLDGGVISPSKSGEFCSMNKGMNRQDILDRLRESEAALRALGVTHAALFGSQARGDNRPDSDTDIMIEVDPEAHVTVYDYVDGRVDVVSRDGLKPYVRPAAWAAPCGDCAAMYPSALSICWSARFW